VAARPELFVSPADLRVGGTLDVFGRKLRLRACDAATRAWYASAAAAAEYGVSAQPDNIFEADPRPAPRALVPPPHTGFGDVDDSLQSCYSIQPRPVRKDYGKWATMDGVAFRFHAQLAGAAPLHAGRRFTITVYPADDSLAVFETGAKAGGYGSAKFLARARHRKPDGSLFTAADFAIGAVTPIFAHRFLVTDVDKFTRER
jgi:hypothetical protein